MLESGVEMIRIWIILFPCVVFARVFLISDMSFNSRSMGLRNSDFAMSSQYSDNVSNPAFLADRTLMYLSSTYFNHFDDINSGSISMTYPDILIEGSSTAFSVASINYGNFKDIETGFEYNPYDIMVTVSQGLDYRKVLFGMNIKYVYSSITSDYNSGALITDLAALYRLMKDQMTAGIGIFGIGVQTDEYYNSTEEIDTHLRGGISYKIEKLPLKISCQYDYYLSDISRYAIGFELDAKKNLMIRAGYDFSGNDKEIGSNNKIERFGGISLGTSILFDAFGFDFSYIVNGELDEEFCGTLNLKVLELLK